MRALLRRALRRLGVDVVRYRPVPPHLQRRANLLAHAGTTLVLDVGANTGQFASELRSIGYHGRIVSFEPLPDAYARLAAAAADDDAWETVQTALGERDAVLDINVAANSWSSSLRPVLDAHLRVDEASRTVRTERVGVTTLDAVFDRFARPGETDRIWLKIDTQGYEREVLAGATRSLPRVGVVQVEMSLVPLYEGQMLFPEMYAWLSRLGYACTHLEPILIDPADQRLLQVDGYFARPGPYGAADGVGRRGRQSA